MKGVNQKASVTLEAAKAALFGESGLQKAFRRMDGEVDGAIGAGDGHYERGMKVAEAGVAALAGAMRRAA